MISVIHYQGIEELSSLSINYLFKDDFLLDPYGLSYVMCMRSSPWSVKPLFGFISDRFPVFGFRRKSYLGLFSLLQTGFWVIFCFYSYNLGFALVTLLMIDISMVFCSVIGGFYYNILKIIIKRGHLG